MYTQHLGRLFWALPLFFLATFFIANESAASPETEHFEHWYVDIRKAVNQTDASGEHLQPSGIIIQDVDGDGHKDLLVSSGYEQYQQPVVVLFNQKGRIGINDSAPSFAPFSLDNRTYKSQSAKIEKICAADIDKDGCLDFVSAGVQVDKKIHHVYRNRPVDSVDGAACEGYEKTPTYALNPVTPEETVNSMGFGCAFGDADGDGDLDLAVSVAYSDEFSCSGGAPSRCSKGTIAIYENEEGHLNRTSTWQISDDESLIHAGDVQFADVNQDGVMDLAVSATGARVYFGEPAEAGSTIKKNADYVAPQTAPNTLEYSSGIDVGWLDGFSSMAVAISMNNNSDQREDTGLDHIFVPHKNKLAETQYHWSSQSRGPGADIRLANINPRLDVISARYAQGEDLQGVKNKLSMESAISTCTTPVDENSSANVYFDIASSGGGGSTHQLDGYHKMNILGQNIRLSKIGGMFEKRTFTQVLGPRQSVVTIRDPRGQTFISEVLGVTTKDGQQIAYTRAQGANWVSIPMTKERDKNLKVTVTYLAADNPDVVIADGCGFIHVFQNPNHATASHVSGARR